MTHVTGAPLDQLTQSKTGHRQDRLAWASTCYLPCQKLTLQPVCTKTRTREKHVVLFLLNTSQVPPRLSITTAEPPYLFLGDPLSPDTLLPAYPLVPSPFSTQMPE